MPLLGIAVRFTRAITAIYIEACAAYLRMVMSGGTGAVVATITPDALRGARGRQAVSCGW